MWFGSVPIVPRNFTNCIFLRAFTYKLSFFCLHTPRTCHCLCDEACFSRQKQSAIAWGGKMFGEKKSSISRQLLPNLTKKFCFINFTNTGDCCRREKTYNHRRKTLKSGLYKEKYARIRQRWKGWKGRYIFLINLPNSRTWQEHPPPGGLVL